MIPPLKRERDSIVRLPITVDNLVSTTAVTSQHNAFVVLLTVEGWHTLTPGSSTRTTV